jgi:hypothetical protein
MGYLGYEVLLSYFPDFEFIKSNQNVDRNLKGYLVIDDVKIELDSSNYLEELAKIKNYLSTELEIKTHYHHDTFSYYSKVHIDSFFNNALDNILLFRNEEAQINIVTKENVYHNFYDVKEPILYVEFVSDSRRLVIHSPSEKQVKSI